MIRFLSDIFFNFFLHIQVNTLNLPHINRLPRPYKANPVSRYLRRWLEKRWIRRFVGLNLATAMLAVPLLNPFTHPQGSPLSPDLLPASDVVLTDSLPPVHTTPRETVNPVPDMRDLSQGYRNGHLAWDLTAQLGSPVLAFSAGQVVYLESGFTGYGHYLILDHGHGLLSVYAHLKRFQVTLGQVVNAGDQIGQIGLTGFTTGPHLHFEIHDNGIQVNPASFIKL